MISKRIYKLYALKRERNKRNMIIILNYLPSTSFILSLNYLKLKQTNKHGLVQTMFQKGYRSNKKIVFKSQGKMQTILNGFNRRYFQYGKTFLAKVRITCQSLHCHSLMTFKQFIPFLVFVFRDSVLFFID